MPKTPRNDEPRESRGAARPARAPKPPAEPGALERSSERPAPRPARPRDGSELAEKTPQEALKAVFEHAGRLFAIKDWSRAGLVERLGERFGKHPEAVSMAEAAAARLAELGILDDVRYARGFLRSRLGKRSLQAALREVSRKGVSKEDAEAAVEQLREEGILGEPVDHAFEVWKRKFGELPLDERERGRQTRFMAARGFSFSAISKVWARAKEEASG